MEDIGNKKLKHNDSILSICAFFFLHEVILCSVLVLILLLVARNKFVGETYLEEREVTCHDTFLM